MAGRKISARDIILQVEDATPNSWLAINGLNSVVPNYAEGEEEEATTDYNSGGNGEHEKMERGASMALQGFVILDDVTGAQDAGQARCELMATKVAHESLGRVRFRHPLKNEWKIWRCSFSIGEQGGGNNAKTPFNCTIKRSGASTTAAV